MSIVDIEQALQAAILHHQAGELPRAESIYRQILAQQPRNANALHLLGMIANQVGRHDLAVDYIEQSISVQANYAPLHSSLGEAYRGLGQWNKAIASYRRALALQPDYPDAHNNMGIVYFKQGRFDDAITSYRDALAIQPENAAVLNNLSHALISKGMFEEAVVSCRQAVALLPTSPIVYDTLGTALRGQRKLDEAIACHQQALTLNPRFPDALNNLGTSYFEKEMYDAAITAYHHALEIQQDNAAAYSNLGLALTAKGSFDEAVASCHKALALQPDNPAISISLGTALLRQGNHDAAITSFRRAIGLNPSSAQAYSNLGISLTASGKTDEAVIVCQKAVFLQPDSAEANVSLGNAYLSQGRYNEAIAAFRAAVRQKPDTPFIHSILVFALHYNHDFNSQALLLEHRRWEAQHGEPRRAYIKPYLQTADPNRRLKIGYVSPDFQKHAVGRFLLPLLANHDHERFEICCYADVACPDDMTVQLRSHADNWQETFGYSEEQLADLIHTDKIDVLVDLALHTAGNRLPVFARKPAPVQVTYLAYPDTSGLKAMDYRLTDPYLEPPDTPDGYSSETPFPLPDTYWCYQPSADIPYSSALPVLTNGYVTFGCLNNFAKVSPAALDVWIRLLALIPDSRLLLYSREGSHQKHVRAKLNKAGISPNRLRFVGNAPITDFIRYYEAMDIALDPFPFAGGTTTCDALWMGVPVITLAGKTAIGRGGVSIMSNIGLQELIAYSEDEYVGIAAGLANDLLRLAALRTGMHKRMLVSSLMDAPRFVRGLETAYRTMWQLWCDDNSASRT